MESVEKEFKEFLETKISAEALERNQKMSKLRLKVLIIEFIIMSMGFTLLIVYTSWQVALAIFLIKWANNMAMIREVNRKNKNSLINIWKDY